MDPKQSKTVIRCTADNVGEFRSLVKRWPELNALVDGLRKQDMFPGLRSLRITLTGSPEQVAAGLGAVMPENASEADQGGSHAAQD